MKFRNLEINESILKAVEEQGYTTPTPIQEQAIPHALAGKDILGCAQTGTGKTAAFLIPTIQHLKQHNSTKIRSLVLTPTRELAIQIQENVVAYAKHTSIKSAVIFGGVPQRPQERLLKQGVDIVIATPGRLLDLMKQKIINIGHIEIFILDEADRMLDMGFLTDVKKIIASLPEKKQTLFFSATMPKEIKALTQTLLHNPVVIEVTPPSSTVENIKQTLYYVDKANKKLLLLDLLKDNKIGSTLVFTRTKSTANRLGKFLEDARVGVEIIHGNKSQAARQNALAKFKSGATRVLVATDIAARGIDINELSYVFNYDIPNEAEAYVHRIGRTGRAGNEGTSISFADIDEVELVKSIQKLIRLEIPVNREHKYPMKMLTLSPKKKQRNSSVKPGRTKSKDTERSSEKKSTEGRSTHKKSSDSRSAEKRSTEGRTYSKKNTEAVSVDNSNSEGRSFDRKSSDTRSVGTRSTEGRSYNRKNTDARSTEGRSFDRKSSDTRSAGTRSTEGRSYNRKSTDTRSTEGRGFDKNNSDTRSAGTRSTEGRSYNRKSTDTRSTEGRGFDKNSSDTRSAGTRSYNRKSTDTRSTEGRSYNRKSTDTRGTEGRSYDRKSTEKRGSNMKTMDKKSIDSTSIDKKSFGDKKVADTKSNSYKPFQKSFNKGSATKPFANNSNAGAQRKPKQSSRGR